MQPQQFMAEERKIVEDAYPGDIIGIFDNGTLGVGDTLYEGKKKVTFSDFPTFPPELFARIRAKDSMKRKQFLKGMTQLAQEGAVQIYETSVPWKATSSAPSASCNLKCWNTG